MKSVLIACLLLTASACAWAQADQRPLTCDRSGEVSNPVSYAFAGVASYGPAERACWADWAKAQALASGADGQWVDVRDAGARRLIALSGVVTVEPADLASKAFLQGQSLVLIGTGVDLKALSARCVALRQSGQFKDVHVLLHGTRAWRQAGQPAQLDASALAPDVVSAQELWLGAADDQWRIAAIGLSDDQIKTLPVPPGFIASGAQLKRDLTEWSVRARQSDPGEPHRRWLMVTATADQMAQARAVWNEHFRSLAADTPFPLWLDGAWPAYANYLQQQQNLAAHAGQALPRLCGL